MGEPTEDDVWKMEDEIRNIEFTVTPHPGWDKKRYQLTFFIDSLGEYEMEGRLGLRGKLFASYILGLACHKMRKLLDKGKWKDEPEG